MDSSNNQDKDENNKRKEPNGMEDNFLSKSDLEKLVQSIFDEYKDEIEKIVGEVPDVKEVRLISLPPIKPQNSLPTPEKPKDLYEGNYFLYNDVQVLYFDKQGRPNSVSMQDEDRVAREGCMTYFTTMYGVNNEYTAKELAHSVIQRIEDDFNSGKKGNEPRE